MTSCDANASFSDSRECGLGVGRYSIDGFESAWFLGKNSKIGNIGSGEGAVLRRWLLRQIKGVYRNRGDLRQNLPIRIGLDAAVSSSAAICQNDFAFEPAATFARSER